ncbi:methyltransferase [Candidatus Woesearchaeota archaeon]|nr:methyltransferase [Candidatus Woesearchaeota archaeon]
MPHYYSKDQDSKPDIKKILIRVDNQEFYLYSGSGVFSKKRLDKGSKILIENCIIKSNWAVHDLGCGNGVVGVSLKKIHPDISVVMSDINKRAVKLAKKNIMLHSLEEIKVIQSDVYENIKESFDTILLNPPQTAGKEVCYKMIEKSYAHLNKGGLVQVVARHNKGGKSLSKKIKNVFGNMRTVAKKSGYRVYIGEKV